MLFLQKQMSKHTDRTYQWSSGDPAYHSHENTGRQAVITQNMRSQTYVQSRLRHKRQSHKTETRHHNGHPKTRAYVWTMVMDIEKKTRYRSVKVLNALLSRMKMESYEDRMETNKTHQNTQENRRKGNISSCLWHGTRNFF